MKKPACLIALAFSFALLFSPIAFAEPVANVSEDVSAEPEISLSDEETVQALPANEPPADENELLLAQAVESVTEEEEPNEESVASSSRVAKSNAFFRDDTVYYLSPAANGASLLDAAGGSPRVGSNVSVWKRNNGNNQGWFLKLGNDGLYTIFNAANSSLVLDAAGWVPHSGSNVSSWSANGGNNQKWTIEQSGDAFVIRNAANPSLVLDASGTAPRYGANVSVWNWNGGNNQKWTIKSQEDIYSDMDNLAAAHRNVVDDGSYSIFAPGIADSPVVDVKDGATYDGANIQTGSSCSAASQIWEIAHYGDYVVIKNKNSNKYLTVESSNSLSGTNVVQGSDPNARGSKWVFVSNGDGTFSVRSALHSDISLDICGGGRTAGTNIEIWDTNSTAAQRFALIASPASVSTCDEVIDTDKYYFIKSSQNNGLQLDVTSASTANNANIELWNANKVPWQIFRFERVGGYYRIINVHTNKALSVFNSSAVPGSNVVTYDVNGWAANQLWQAIRNADGSFSFINVNNGLALEVASSSPHKGINVDTSWCSFEPKQKFSLEAFSDLMPTGTYSLQSVLSSTQVLDVTRASAVEHANIEIWSNNDGLAQKWNIQLVSGKENTYTFQALCSGRYLYDNGAGNAVQAGTNDDVNAQWVPSIVGGSYVLTNVGTGRVLGVTNSATNAGANVGTEPNTGNANQRWNLNDASPLKNGTYVIRSAADSDKVLDVAGKATGNNANVDLWQFNDGKNQKFNFSRNSDGSYTIINCNSGKALDACQASATPGTNIAQYTPNGQSNQRWYVVFTNEGTFKLVSAMNSSIVIGLSGSTPSDGTNVCLNSDSGVTTQRFSLEQVSYTPTIAQHQSDMINRAQGYSSGTSYMIMVDRGAHKVGVFHGSRGNWSCQQYWSCVTGASGSPTITGTYRTTGYKKMTLSTDSRARWCTQINGGYFFHTILASESELGFSLSHGCIRLAVPSAQWIYQNIGGGTTVVIYN